MYSTSKPVLSPSYEVAFKSIRPGYFKRIAVFSRFQTGVLFVI